MISLPWVLEEENTYPKSDRFYVKGESDMKAEKVKNARKKSPVRIGRLWKDSCSHCGGKMMDMLTVDGREERFVYLCWVIPRFHVRSLVKRVNKYFTNVTQKGRVFMRFRRLMRLNTSSIISLSRTSSINHFCPFPIFVFLNTVCT